MSPTIGGVPSVDARELFAPLGPSYDRVGATLSLRSGPALAPLPRLAAPARRRPRPRRRDRNGPRRGRAPPARVRGHRRRPERRDARARSRSDSATRVELVEASAEALPFADATFDHLTVTYLLRYVDDPGATLAELARVVRPGGVVASLEFGVPCGPRAPGVGALRARRPPARGPRAAERLARGRRLPRRVDPLVLGGVPARASARALVGSGHRGRRGPTDEPRRRSRHLGPTP